ncbi:MAG: c-type cytochrome biogenesis protein CcsB [Bacteroidales bacterium]
MKTLRILFSPMFTGVLFIILAVALALATFIENDYGASAVRGMVYNALWFEILIAFIALNLVGQIIVFRLYRREKLSVFLFHAAFMVIIAGSAITRYTGEEGIMHIREGEEAGFYYSDDNYITASVFDRNGNQLWLDDTKFDITSLSVDKYRKQIALPGKDITVTLNRFIPNVVAGVADAKGGKPAAALMITTGLSSREDIILAEGEFRNAGGLSIGLNTDEKCDINIITADGKFMIITGKQVSETAMDSRETILYDPGDTVLFNMMNIYVIDNTRIIPRSLSLSGVIKPVPVDMSQERTGQNALEFQIGDAAVVYTAYIWDTGDERGSQTITSTPDFDIAISYGRKRVEIPFSLKLNEFTLERYPGSNSPSGYMSDVVVTDRERGIEKPYLIYMNNILKYRGIRFYQSSYDKDEKGTILSVNRDRAGMLVTYAGYGLMIIFIVLAIFNPSSHFRRVTGSYWNSPFRKFAVLLLLLTVTSVGKVSAQRLVVDRKTADEFGKVLVQDQKGRTKPLYTLSGDIVRKVSRENRLDSYVPMQVFLGLYLDFDNWSNYPMIKVNDATLRRFLGIRSDFAAFSDIVNLSASPPTYRLAGFVDNAYAKPPGSRSKSDKEVIKLDERVNICYMIYSGDFMKIFPLRDGTTHWGAPEEALQYAPAKEDSLFLGNIMQMYGEALRTNNLANASQITKAIIEYQERFASYDLPQKNKISAELLYSRLKIFERLFPVYASVGVVMLLILIILVISGKGQSYLPLKVLAALLAAGFLMHTFGLGLRWYISGHSPMSNGYESMIFISWVTLLAGFIFGRKSWFAMSATAVLAGLTLLVAHMSFMDPEITALVPVLQSYWLTLHVSVITASYAFFGLGALLGLISLLLIIFASVRNVKQVGKTLDELAAINYQSLTLGLYFLTIGTFLGAIWANESWGRYWGWDPKETWSLITIIIYAFVIHSRNIPGMKDLYTFNVMSLFAIASVLMTYFGVNYYLSGLHSYAGGDPVPVPAMLYILVATVLLLAIFSYRKYLKLENIAANQSAAGK